MEVKLTKYKSNIHDIKKSKITNIDCNLKILYYLFILCFLCNLTNEQISNSISKITLTIKGSGYQNVLIMSIKKETMKVCIIYQKKLIMLLLYGIPRQQVVIACFSAYQI